MKCKLILKGNKFYISLYNVYKADVVKYNILPRNDKYTASSTCTCIVHVFVALFRYHEY